MQINITLSILLLLSTFMLASCQPANQEFVPVQFVSETAVPLPTATPVPTQISLVTPDVKSSQEVNLVDIAYTQDNPVTDNQKIILILDDFLSRYLSQFSKPGWYYFPNDNQNSHWMHIPEQTDENHFDMFLSTTKYHTYAPGFIWPFSIVLQDGSWGFSRLSPRLDDYQFNQGGEQPEIEFTLNNLDFFAGGWDGAYFGHTNLLDFLDLLHNPGRMIGNTKVSRTFSGWTQQVEGKDVFVLLNKTTYLGNKPQIQDSLQTIDQENIYTYFDLQNGGRIYEKYVLYLENGEVVNDELQFNQHLVQYYEVLPEDIQTVYDEAAQKLKGYLEEQ